MIFRPFLAAFFIRLAIIGCASVVLEPINKSTSARSKSSNVLVGDPLPNIVARPATLGACQVRLQPSILLLPMAVRMNFCKI